MQLATCQQSATTDASDPQSATTDASDAKDAITPQSATTDASDAKDARHDGASPLGLAFLEFFHNYSWVCIEALLRMHLLCKLPQFHPVLQDPIRAQIPKGWVKVEACEPCCCC